MVGVLLVSLACVSASVAGAATITVPSIPVWTDSGIDLTPGDTLFVHGAAGMWNWGTSYSFGPQGDYQPGLAWDEWIPNGQHGELIGYIGVNPYAAVQNDFYLFGIGTGTVTRTGDTGRLWLGFNDDFSSGGVGDNSGSVTVCASVPEPATILLWAGLGALGLVVARRGRK
jgi:hypothetical protein